MADSGLPPFDPKAKCAKCGNEIPDPQQPTKHVAGPDGAVTELPTGPLPQPQPPTVHYCNGMDCPWDAETPQHEREPLDEHMHQFCEVCGYEWLTAPLS